MLTYLKAASRGSVRGGVVSPWHLCKRPEVAPGVGGGGKMGEFGDQLWGCFSWESLPHTLEEKQLLQHDSYSSRINSVSLN